MSDGRYGPAAAEVAGAFTRLTGHHPAGVWSSPGRVNLIGDHTDYHEGLVLPMAIDRSATVAVGVRGDRAVRCSSRQMRAEVTLALADIAPGRVEGWARYPLGVLWAMARAGLEVPGLDVVIDSGSRWARAWGRARPWRLPWRSLRPSSPGLRSPPTSWRDAAMRERSRWPARRPVSWTSSRSLECRAGHALLLDCRDTDPRAGAARQLGNIATVLVIDTTVVHDTAGAGFRTRRQESAEAARRLGVRSLRDATLAAVGSRLAGIPGAEPATWSPRTPGSRRPPASCAVATCATSGRS